MRPLLLDISITDKERSASDACELMFDDTDGVIALEGDGKPVAVSLAGVEVFSGTVDSIRSSGSRGSGRVIRMSAKGFDMRGPAKEPQSFHKGDSTLEDFLSEAARNAGYALTVDPAIASLTRDHWAAGHESFLALGQRLAREHHATFKLRDNRAIRLFDAAAFIHHCRVLRAMSRDGLHAFRADPTGCLRSRPQSKAIIRSLLSRLLLQASAFTFPFVGSRSEREVWLIGL